MTNKYENELPDDLFQQVMALSKEGDRFQMGHITVLQGVYERSFISRFCYQSWQDWTDMV